MERMWRKVNQGLSSRATLSKSSASTAVNSTGGPTDTLNSAGVGSSPLVVAVVGNCNTGSNNMTIVSNTTTGRRLASSGQPSSLQQHRSTSLSQHVISTASSDRRRKRRRKSRPRRSADRNFSASKMESLQSKIACSLEIPHPASKFMASTQPVTFTTPSTIFCSATTNETNTTGAINAVMSTLPPAAASTVSAGTGNGNAVSSGGNASGDPSLRQRAVAKLRLFNFHLNWDLHMSQCKPCGPRSSGNILTRRLCRNRRREDNELYRSNSFKFERFERKEFTDGANEILQKQISVCDDYSLPIDFVKKRPSSFDPCLADTIPDAWSAPSPVSEHVTFLEPSSDIGQSFQAVKLVEGYSDPKDSKKTEKYYRKNRNKDKRITQNSDSSAPKSSAEDENQSNKIPELNSPDSISEDLIRPLQTHKSPKRITGPDNSKRNPSPYYYSDLLKSKDGKDDINLPKLKSKQSIPPESFPHIQGNISVYKKSSSLDVPELEREVQLPKRYSITEDGVRIIRCDSPSTTTSDDSDCSECRKRREWHAKALALVRESCDISTNQQNPTLLEDDNIDPTHNKTSMPPHRLLGPAVCACAAPALGEDIDDFFRPRSIFYVHPQGVHECGECTALGSDKSTNTEAQEEEMSGGGGGGGGGRTRQIYETAFDCKITRSDDDLDEVDRLTNHSVLLQISNGNTGAVVPPLIGTAASSSSSKKERHKFSKSRNDAKRTKNSKNQIKQDNSGSVITLSHELENVHIDNNMDNINNANTSSGSQLPIRGYTPSPPSTAPLPIKFPGKHDRFFMNSIKSAPNLPSSNPAHPRLKDLRLPVQTIRQQHEVPIVSGGGGVGGGGGGGGGGVGSILEGSYSSTQRRPRSVVLESGRVLELRKSHQSHHQRGRNYSSTESMATSSSGGSMESLRSSTSEGNRSTTSSESRHSTSLSSHSSDSGHSLAFPLRAPVVLHSKLHILSPISDKSSQEPVSETSEVNNKNNNSQKVSPDESIKQQVAENTDEPTIIDVQKMAKRRILPNKSILHLTDEILGSDSGISLHSREDGKPQNVFHKFAMTKLNIPPENDSELLGHCSGGLPQDLRDLPFDMPKLRRRKIALQQDPFTSGSATSVDLGDLPFDMPKLRRRLRMNHQQGINILVHSTESSGVSQASSSYSVRDENKQIAIEPGAFRQNLTLNLNESKPPTKFGSLDLKASSRALNLNLNNSGFPTAIDLIDVSLPLDRQGWYHGAVTRVEAESTLRKLTEGSFLVRNCESTKQDYSLSLKSAKGFMHMRIQRNDAGKYILGQFSRPFESVPEMIRHFCLNRLPVRGAEHMCLVDPVIAQLL